MVHKLWKGHLVSSLVSFSVASLVPQFLERFGWISLSFHFCNSETGRQKWCCCIHSYGTSEACTQSKPQQLIAIMDKNRWIRPEFPLKQGTVPRAVVAWDYTVAAVWSSHSWRNHSWLCEMTIHVAAFRVDYLRKSWVKRNSKTTWARRKLCDEWVISGAAERGRKKSVSFLIVMFSAWSFLSTVTKIYSDTNPITQSTLSLSLPFFCISLSTICPLSCWMSNS